MFNYMHLFLVELEQMFHEYDVRITEVDERKLPQPFGSRIENLESNLCGHTESGSGGYAEFILRYAAKQLFDEPDIAVQFKKLRNPDFQEAVFQKNGQTLLTFAVVNGFRNIQNIVQKLKRGKCAYDYVEVMACPSGKFCLNDSYQY